MIPCLPRSTVSVLQEEGEAVEWRMMVTTMTWVLGGAGCRPGRVALSLQSVFSAGGVKVVVLLSDVNFMSGRLDQAPAGRVRRDTGNRGRGGGDRGERDDQL